MPADPVGASADAYRPWHGEGDLLLVVWTVVAVLAVVAVVEVAW